MRITSWRAAWVAVGLLAALTPAAQAQRRLLAGQAAEVPPTEAAAPAVRVSVAAATPGLSIQTTVRVPDGGTAVLGGYGTAAASRAEYGVPGLGKVPVVGRGARNVGYGRTTTSRKAGVTVRVIDLREEEFRQTGFRGP